ncbi:hydrogenase formation protein HypD [Clostridium sp.]|uniref:hydrogenase formation protein HypD n=1 Tax=Clostridium sp. TaxID=1506 RepID=UPI002FCBB8D3
MDDKLKILLKEIEKFSREIRKDNINIMEVCGTHTHVIYDCGIKDMLPKKINLISGPGCPICVTEKSFIDNAIAIGRQDVTIITFGDIAKVRGSNSSLIEERRNGLSLRIIYSLDSILNICREDAEKNYVFLGVGFETTTPLIANIIKKAHEENIKNLYFYNSLKIMPPILNKILVSSDSIDGFILPGHVAVIQGEEEFRLLFANSEISSVIAGFSFEDILASIYFLLKAIYKKQCGENIGRFKNVYKSYVQVQGNLKAKELMTQVFQVVHGKWRGIGIIENSSLIMREKYSNFNAIVKFKLEENADYIESKDSKCRCSEVIMGKINPESCSLFKTICTTENPQGPCMISMEGTCYCAYKFTV